MLIIIIMIMTIIMALVMVTLTYFYATLIFLVPSSFCTSTFNCEFSVGDFVDITPTTSPTTDKAVDKDADDDDENEVDEDGKEKSPKLLAVPLKGVSRIIIDIHPLKPIWNTEYASCSWKDKAFSTRPRLCMWRNYCMVLVNSL